MKTFIITDNAGEKILLHHEEANDSWILVSYSKVSESPRCATVLNPDEAQRIAKLILEVKK